MGDMNNWNTFENNPANSLDEQWEALSAFHDSELDELEMQELELTLNSNSEINHDFQAIQALSGALKRLPSVEPPPTLRLAICNATTRKQSWLKQAMPLMKWVTVPALGAVVIAVMMNMQAPFSKSNIAETPQRTDNHIAGAIKPTLPFNPIMIETKAKTNAKAVAEHLEASFVKVISDTIKPDIKTASAVVSSPAITIPTSKPKSSQAVSAAVIVPEVNQIKTPLYKSLPAETPTDNTGNNSEWNEQPEPEAPKVVVAQKPNINEVAALDAKSAAVTSKDIEPNVEETPWISAREMAGSKGVQWTLIRLKF